jgi:hypothetical protein
LGGKVFENQGFRRAQNLRLKLKKAYQNWLMMPFL